ncbi:ABC transporter substrate-binding protein (plasmid) [Deinococcus metallilatus]|uniref:ABC transporter substrate-binding protein n=1 Tax=Deinococcus metallilatus TaxID=1211322 RepID=A0AAJ5F683_9DEIO|nr:ABC transporter substrate-binding protein [Deinococcus metallilatus]MBB5293459.1 multiple sugar transport system substrate-binding protein [Deinococcus metallilatus]QBY06545.1 ABC transporter substrate-binding protein [Deinococcus metallilatus]RXJ17888.1 ABC transporter substrate-binding protein [Deinococcus metallilatus]TLK32160.1 ABC transporter substrate-binding protein [Deinococcus metallilatus]GMA15321.1 ABC transporter [Deinococcus metallilatus]
MLHAKPVRQITRRRTHRLSLVIGCGLSLGALTPALAAPPSNIKATLNVVRFGDENDVKTVGLMIQRFHKRYPNVTVKVQRFTAANGWPEYLSNVMNLIASGNPPDILDMPLEGVSTVASRGLMLDLDALAAKDGQAKELLNDVEPNIINSMRYNKQLVFFPTAWNNIVIYYNKGAFKKAGLQPPSSTWTWDDFLKAAQKLTVRDAKGKVTQYGYYVPAYGFGLTPWFLTNGTDKLTPDWRRSNVKDPRFRESLQFLHDLIYKYKVSPAFQAGAGESAFVSQQAAMISIGHWPIASFVKSFKDFDVAVVPRKTASNTVFGGEGNGILKTSKNPELAWEFIKELTSKQSQAELAGAGLAIPARRSAASLPAFLNFPANSGIFYGSAKTAVPIASPPNFSQVEDILMRNVTAYMTNNQTLDAALNNMDRELTRSLSRVKW